MTCLLYMVTWTTWQENPVSTPWEFWFVSQGVRYRRREGSTSMLTATDGQIAAAFDRRDSAYLEELEQEFINDVKLMAFVPAVDALSAQQSVTQLFLDAEFDRTQCVDDATRSAITDLVRHSQQIKT